MNNPIISKTLLALSIAAATVPANAAVSTRIIGGTPAQSGTYPWMVSLQGNGSHFCGASLIARDWVLTAAHCVEGESAGGVQAVIGEFDLNSQSDGGQQRAVSRIIIHPQRQSGSEDHDIALLQLKSAVTGSPVMAATSTLMQNVTPGKLLTVMGWGNQSTTGEQFPNKLFEVQVPYVSNASCGNYNPGEITENMLCAGFPQGGKDSCQGDSGGPLLYQLDGQWHQVGIVSFGQGCAQPDYPGVYARVEKYNDWIGGYVANSGDNNQDDSGTGGDTDAGNGTGGNTDGGDSNTGDTDNVPGNNSGDDNSDVGDTGDTGGDSSIDDSDMVDTQSAEMFNLPEYIDIFSQEGVAEEVVVLLENVTDQAVGITDIFSDSDQFSVEGNTCSSLQPGASCALTVTYKPAANQDYAFGTMSIVLNNGNAVSVELYGEDLSLFEDNFAWDDDFGFDWFADDDYWHAEEDEFGLFCNAVRTGGRAVMSAQFDGPGVLEFDLLLPDDVPENRVTYLVDGKPVRTMTGAQQKTAKHRTELSAGKHQVSWIYKKNKETNGQVKVSNVKFTRVSAENAPVAAESGGGGSSDLGLLAGMLLLAGLVRCFLGAKS